MEQRRDSLWQSDGMPVTAEAVTWAFRLFIGREPRDAAEIGIHQPHSSLRNLRIALAQSNEFQVFHNSVIERPKPAFGLPTFMLRPLPAGVSWQFVPPTMQAPVSQCCTAAQFSEPAFAEVAEAMALANRLHRSVWESVWIATTLATLGCIAPGKRAVGLGVRRERLTSLLASRGMSVTALRMAETTEADLPQQHALLNLFYPEIVAIEDFDALVRMTDATPGDPLSDTQADFDCVWSQSVAHRLGSPSAGLDFITQSLAVLRPGGVAVHTFDLNLSSNAEPDEDEQHIAFRRADLDILAERLTQSGFEVRPINLHPGFDDADAVVDAPPFGLPHLKVLANEAVLGSFGLAIRKPT